MDKNEYKILAKPYNYKLDPGFSEIVDKICSELDLEPDCLSGMDFNNGSCLLIYIFSLYIKNRTGLDFYVDYYTATPGVDSYNRAVSRFGKKDENCPPIFCLSMNLNLYTSIDNLNIQFVLLIYNEKYHPAIYFTGRDLLGTFKNFSWEQLAETGLDCIRACTRYVSREMEALFSEIDCTCTSGTELCQMLARESSLPDPVHEYPRWIQTELDEFIRAKTWPDNEFLLLLLGQKLSYTKTVKPYYMIINRLNRLDIIDIQQSENESRSGVSDKYGPGICINLNSYNLGTDPAPILLGIIDGLLYFSMLGVNFKLNPLKGIETFARLDMDRLRSVYMDLANKIRTINSNMDNFIMLESKLSCPAL